MAIRLVLLCVALAAASGPAAQDGRPGRDVPAPPPASPPPPSRSASSASSPSLDLLPRAAGVRLGGVVTARLQAPQALVRATAAFLGTSVALSPADEPGTWEALLGVDLDVRPGTYPVAVTTVTAAGLEETVSRPIRVLATRYPTRRLRVAPRFVEPPASELARITGEAARLTAIFSSTSPRHWRGAFALPAPGRPTSSFGLRSVFNGQARNPHAGADFPGLEGTPITAPNAGTVVLAEELYFTGNTVVVDHGAGLYSLFAHLSRIDVRPGDTVALGQMLGQLGATGRVTGPHLHWAVRLLGARVDPLAVVAASQARP